MKLSTKTIIEITGVVAVILSLLFVAAELRQSNRIAIGNAELTLRILNAEVNRVIFESDENDDIFVKLTSIDADLSPEEYQRAIYIAYMHFNRWQATEQAFVNSLVSERTLQIELEDVSVLFQRLPGFAPIFLELMGQYPTVENDISRVGAQVRAEAGKYLD